ncbi:hypothetical protein GCM10009603_24250 [Nocardiopsis exhalans]
MVEHAGHADHQCSGVLGPVEVVGDTPLGALKVVHGGALSSVVPVASVVSAGCVACVARVSRLMGVALKLIPLALLVKGSRSDAGNRRSGGHVNWSDVQPIALPCEGKPGDPRVYPTYTARQIGPKGPPTQQRATQ